MENTRETTRLLLAQSLKQLMARGLPFEKITVCALAREAGVIRPTFYNHFQDKYQLLEWIWQRQVLDPLRPLMEAGMVQEALRLAFTRLAADRDFYLRALRIEGQNSFADIVLERTALFFEEYMQRDEARALALSPLLTNRNIALYCANDFLFVLQHWARTGFHMEAAQVAQAYLFMIAHSPQELLHPDPDTWAEPLLRIG